MATWKVLDASLKGSTDMAPDDLARMCERLEVACAEMPDITLVRAVPVLNDITRLIAAVRERDVTIRKLRETLDLAIKAACQDCADGIPTDKTWGHDDGHDRHGLYHPDRQASGVLGGGYHKCKAWKIRAALAATGKEG